MGKNYMMGHYNDNNKVSTKSNKYLDTAKLDVDDMIYYKGQDNNSFIDRDQQYSAR